MYIWATLEGGWEFVSDLQDTFRGNVVIYLQFSSSYKEFL